MKFNRFSIAWSPLFDTAKDYIVCIYVVDCDEDVQLPIGAGANYHHNSAARCPHCSAQYATMSQLKAHYQKHKNGELSEVSNAPAIHTNFTCSTGGQMFPHHGNYVRHITTHTDAKSYECE